MIHRPRIWRRQGGGKLNGVKGPKRHRRSAPPHDHASNLAQQPNVYSPA
jgi:hypothetical protein